MKVDKRHKMYGIANANYCVSMSFYDYERLQCEPLNEHFGPQYCTTWYAEMHRRDISPVIKDWYIEQSDKIMTLYFPTLEMADLCERLLTLCRLKYPKI